MPPLPIPPRTTQRDKVSPAASKQVHDTSTTADVVAHLLQEFPWGNECKLRARRVFSYPDSISFRPTDLEPLFFLTCTSLPSSQLS